MAPLSSILERGVFWYSASKVSGLSARKLIACWIAVSSWLNFRDGQPTAAPASIAAWLAL